MRQRSAIKVGKPVSRTSSAPLLVNVQSITVTAMWVRIATWVFPGVRLLLWNRLPWACWQEIVLFRNPGLRARTWHRHWFALTSSVPFGQVVLRMLWNAMICCSWVKVERKHSVIPVIASWRLWRNRRVDDAKYWFFRAYIQLVTLLAMSDFSVNTVCFIARSSIEFMDPVQKAFDHLEGDELPVAISLLLLHNLFDS